MQTRSKLLLVLALAGLSAATHATALPLDADVSPVAWDSVTTQRTRAEVSAEAVAAVAAGDAVSPEFDTDAADLAVSTKTRAQARAEAAEALRQGLIKLGEASAPEADTFQRQGQAGWHTAAARSAGR